ncbi:MAG: phage BR0599 family protein [Rickettsiaceae bacterium]|nr:phage BR0599 family protein [Rickettsiaceae bacterium]
MGNMFNLKQAKAVYYCFHIKYLCGKQLFLTSNDQDITINNISYKTSSGLSLKEANFTDSGLSTAILHGIFVETAIIRNSQILGARIDIKTVNEKQQLWDFISLYVTKFQQKELDFYLECQSEVIKYNKSLLKIYSQTCRANFADNSCGIDISKFSKALQIIKIEENVVTCEEISKDNNYFKLGIAVFKVKNGGDLLTFKYRIVANSNETLELEGTPTLEIQQAKMVTIIPGCDKQFITCHQKYKNSINFRGEPFIPDDKVLSS